MGGDEGKATGVLIVSSKIFEILQDEVSIRFNDMLSLNTRKL